MLLDNINNLTLNFNQKLNIYNVLEEIIDNLDEYALKELMSGNEKDINIIIQKMLFEINNAFFAPTQTIKANNLDYLDKLTDNFDRELKFKSFNYFKMSVLPSFDMEPYHIEWGSLVQLYKWIAFIAARDHGKSYEFSWAYPMWKLYSYQRETYGKNSLQNSLNKKGMLITNEHSLAKDFLKQISEEIEENPILRERLFKENSFGKESITTKNGAELQVKGSGSALRGRHPGWIVLDDFLDESSLYSSIARENVINLFSSVIMNMILRMGQVIVVGTPFAEGDLYSYLKTLQSWRVFEYPAILPNGQLLSERHSLESLLEKRSSQGSIVFSRENLVKPLTSDSSIFPWSILENSFVGMGEYTLVNNIHSFPRKFKKIVLGIDFAISANVGADYTVLVTIGVDEFDNYWILNITKLHGASHNQQIAKISELKRNFNYDVMMAEDNAFQSVMIQLAKDAGLKVIPHTTGVNKYDLKTGLPGLATVFEQSRIKLPRGDEYSKNITDELCTQAAGFTFEKTNDGKGKLVSTAEHDDILMATWIGVKAANYVSRGFRFGFL